MSTIQTTLSVNFDRRFPYLDKDATIGELSEVCNMVLDNFGDAIDGLLEPKVALDVRRTLMTGTEKARRWAFHTVRVAYRSGARQAYIARLEARKQRACESPMAAYIHPELAEALAWVEVHAGMSDEDISALQTAVDAVSNLEIDAHRAEKTVARGTRKGPPAEQVAKRKRRSERDRDATNARKGSSPSAQPGTMGRQGAKRARVASKR